jgi:nicotinate phosphoribosyltransferase
MLTITGTYTDMYQIAMGQVYFLQGQRETKAIFDYFFRKSPFGGGYAVFAGLDDLLAELSDLRFDAEDLEFLRANGLHAEYIAYLKDFRFRGAIYAAREGDVVFPTHPVLRVEANIIEAQLIETLLLNILNFQTLIATKASRVRLVAGDRLLIDFGLRRAQGLGSYHASRAAIVGGFDATSNVRAGRDFGLAVSGTMAHSFIQSFADELTAFRHFAEGRPDDCVLLVDTYDTLKSGVPHAIVIAKEMAQRGHRLKGIRLDSGDLAYLARQSRALLDAAGLSYVKIAASNQLDEFVVKSLLEQGAPIDVFGVGTNLVTGRPDAALDGVYKLALAGGQARIKLSETISKTTLPDRKQVFRVLNGDGRFLGADVVGLHDENEITVMHHPFEPYKSLGIAQCPKEPLLHQVMAQGRPLEGRSAVDKIAAFCRKRLDLLPAEYKRFDNPHIYKVGISEKLRHMRDRLIMRHKRSML